MSGNVSGETIPDTVKKHAEKRMRTVALINCMYPLFMCNAIYAEPVCIFKLIRNLKAGAWHRLLKVIWSIKISLL
jgi:hypothetical protein